MICDFLLAHNVIKMIVIEMMTFLSIIITISPLFSVHHNNIISNTGNGAFLMLDAHVFVHI